MLTSLRHPPKGFRLALFRFLRRRRAADRRDPSHLAGRLERGEIIWSAYYDAGSALVEAGRFDEADAILERGLAAFPDDRTLLIEHALSAHNSGRYRVAIARWENAIRVAPDDAICHFGLAANLRETGQIEAANEVMAEARRRFPADVGVISEAARVAEAYGRFAEALDLWQQVATRRNPHPDWLRGQVHALALVGRFDEAERAVRAALDRYPDEQVLLAVEGILASSREDWPKAVSLWTEYRRRFPDDGTGHQHYGRAVQGGLFSEADARLSAGAAMDAPGLLAPVEVDIVEDEGLRRLMLGFESIGFSCEFGLVQRRYGAEPLCLLRWNDVGFENLLTALDHRFEGMGDPENTELPMLGNGEFIVKDRRWSLWMHTFQFAGQADPAALYPKMCRRVVFLRDKLLADLAAGAKIFVFHSDGLDAARLEALHRALLAFGPIKLLNVQPLASASGFEGNAGDILKVADDRYVGFIRHLGVTEAATWDIAFDDWTSVCRKAAEALGR